MENPIMQGDLRELFNRIRDVVWLLEARNPRAVKKSATFTGVCVGVEGLLMVGESQLLSYFDGAIFKARRVDDTTLELNATRVETGMWGKKWGIALFKVDGVEKCNVVNFAGNDSLNEGQKLAYLGHPGDLVWSLVPTTVAFSCVGGVQIAIEDNQTCGTYKYVALLVTPEYRKLGHVYNSNFFREMCESQKIMFKDEMERHPDIPVIQCNGLLGCVDCGGPLFNMNGDIVGLVSVEFKGFTFAIHASALDQFLTVTGHSQGRGKGKEKEKAISPKSTMIKTKKRKNV